MVINASILITLSRIVLALMMLITLYLPLSLHALFVLFLVASWTDWLDGFVARKYQQVTEVGAYLDPVADKVLFVSGLVVFCWLTNDGFMALLGGLMVIRELIVSWLRFYLSMARQDRTSLSVSYFAKLKTTFQLLSIGYGLLALQYPNYLPYYICYILIVLAFIFSILSMFGYVKKFYQVLTIIGKKP